MSNSDQGESETVTRELFAAAEARRGGANYVAKPADGYDVRGLWHCFGAGSRTGYATHGVALHWTLSEVLKIRTQLVPHRHLDIDIERFPKDRYDMLFRWTKEAVGHPQLLFCSFPTEVAAELADLGPPVIPYCAFEGTKVSALTAGLSTGKSFKEVWVVSQFVKDAFVAGGVPANRVRVVRPAIALGSEGPWENCGPKMREIEERADRPTVPVSTERPFVFGTLGSWHARKGFHNLVLAYFRTFKRSEPVRLVIRTSAFGTKERTIRDLKERLTAEVAQIAAQCGDNDFPQSKKQPRLEFVLGTDASDSEVIDWLGSLDCYVNPSFGEGLGIPPIWAKCQGIPLVSTAYGAMGDIVREGDGDIAVPHHLAPVDPEMVQLALMFERDTEWGQYRVDDLGAAMLKASNRGRQIDAFGAARARSFFGAAESAQQVSEGLEDNLSAKALAECVGMGAR